MLDKRIHIAIKSYKRTGAVTSLDVFPDASVWVPKSQEKEYRRCYGAKVRTVPNERDGNCPKKMNAILDLTDKKWTLIVDDDIRHIRNFEGGAQINMRPVEIQAMVNHYYALAEEMGVTLWGLNQIHDALAYRTYTPFSLLSAILGPFQAHLSPRLRYDESTLGKEDYDFWLQTIRAHRFTLRVNKYCYMHDSAKKPGGLAGIRTMQFEEKGVRRMKEKWGYLYKSGGQHAPNATGTNILNSLVRVPIPGV